MASPLPELTYPRLLVAASAFFLLSYWLHNPKLYNVTLYGDIYPTLWLRIAASSGIVPYFNYFLEYPPLTAILLWIASIWHNLLDYYNTISLVLYASMIAAVTVVYRLLRESKLSTHNVTYYVIFTPSFLLYSIYSFDWLGVSLLLLSLLFTLRKKPLLAGSFMGLSVAARLIPVVCFPFVYKEFKSTRDRSVLISTSFLAWLAPHLYFLWRDWYSIYYAYVFQASYPVEDSWLNIVTALSSLTTIHLVSALLLVSALASIYFWRRRRFTLLEASMLAMLAFVLTSYKFPPQYLILLMPLLALNKTDYTLTMTANVLNAMIILLWFTPTFNLGNPHVLSSPIQWISIARQLLLLPIFLNYFRTPKSTPGGKEPAKAVTGGRLALGASHPTPEPRGQRKEKAHGRPLSFSSLLGERFAPSSTSRSPNRQIG